MLRTIGRHLASDTDSRFEDLPDDPVTYFADGADNIRTRLRHVRAVVLDQVTNSELAQRIAVAMAGVERRLDDTFSFLNPNCSVEVSPDVAVRMIQDDLRSTVAEWQSKIFGLSDEVDAYGLAPPQPGGPKLGAIDMWTPKPGFVGANELYAKHKVPKSTLSGWKKRHPPPDIDSDPRTKELYFPPAWVRERLRAWDCGRTSNQKKRTKANS